MRLVVREDDAGELQIELSSRIGPTSPGCLITESSV